MNKSNKHYKLKRKSKWDKLFSEGSIRRAGENYMRPKEELDKIVEDIKKSGKLEL